MFLYNVTDIIKIGGLMMKFNNEIYKAHEVKDFRDIIKITTQKYPNNVAYKFKKNLKKDNECVV